MSKSHNSQWVQSAENLAVLRNNFSMKICIYFECASTQYNRLNTENWEHSLLHAT